MLNVAPVEDGRVSGVSKVLGMNTPSGRGRYITYTDTSYIWLKSEKVIRMRLVIPIGLGL